MILCPKCGRLVRCIWRSPVRPEEDEFVCDPCNVRFKRYQKLKVQKYIPKKVWIEEGNGLEN